MEMNLFLKKLGENRDLKSLTKKISDGDNDISLNTSGLIRPLILAFISKNLFKKSIVAVLDSENDCEKWQRTLRSLGIDSHIFPAWESLATDRVSPSPHIVSQRMKSLNHLMAGGSIILTPLRAVVLPVAPPEDKRFLPITISTGMDVTMTQIIEQLAGYGYERALKCEQEGYFAVRGGIIDLFPPNLDLPVRVEFFGDEVESLRYYDPLSQLSVEPTDKVDIFAIREFSLTRERRARVSELLDGIKDMEWIEEDVGKLSGGQFFEGMESYLPFFEKSASHIFDYLSDDNIIILDEKPKLLFDAETIAGNELKYAEENVKSGLMPSHPIDLISTLHDLLANCEAQKVSFQTIKPEETAFEISVEHLPSDISQDYVLKRTLDQLIADKYNVVLSLSDTGTMHRLHEHLQEIGVQPEKIKIQPDSAVSTNGSNIYLSIGMIEHGFKIPSVKLAVISQNDLFKSYAQKEPPRVIKQHGARPISQLSDLETGDLVVHRTHGIGRYAGLTHQTVSNVTNEYLIIEYAQVDKLYIPVTNLDRVAKYIGTAEAPQLTRLGTGDWNKAQQKVKKSLKKLAIDLMALYAERMKNSGYSFSKDNPWQKELEDAFPYQETSDQEKAIQDVKKDMENGKPMDRLVCGDVGYGKTEVAVRAAFKAVTDNKQAIILVPTTLLAQQHFNTVRERMAPFPVRVEMLSRFLPKNKQKIVIDDFSEGQVDVLIGTHRLLQNDVKPKDLGLLIIDEEHRFGVGHKEKIKNIKKNVDVLTLTATPIPRTLQMSLSGIRGLSLMETPPVGRQPVITYVGDFNTDLCKAAIRRELARNGQIYYVHNRVFDIDEVFDRVTSMVPEARIAIAHGQMNELQLQKTMDLFLRHEIDVLICTSIVESGIDIPNANTLIVEDSERFGLAQLYHLRGRVGRSQRRGYAYIFYKSSRPLKTNAFERLKTIGELTQLGSGLKISMKDLELRGTGNLLGPEQHGNIASVGFEMYVSMLDMAVKELKGTPISVTSEVKINLPVNALIPNDYITDETLRIEIYKMLSDISSEKDAKNALKELTDRFGKPAKQVKDLLEICLIKAIAESIGIQKIFYKKNLVSFSPAPFDENFFSELKQTAKVNYKKSELAYELHVISIKSIITEVKQFIKSLKNRLQNLG